MSRFPESFETISELAGCLAGLLLAGRLLAGWLAGWSVGRENISQGGKEDHRKSKEHLKKIIGKS